MSIGWHEIALDDCHRKSAEPARQRVDCAEQVAVTELVADDHQVGGSPSTRLLQTPDRSVVEVDEQELALVHALDVVSEAELHFADGAPSINAASLIE